VFGALYLSREPTGEIIHNTRQTSVGPLVQTIYGCSQPAFWTASEMT